jgi:hypothetical protein
MATAWFGRKTFTIIFALAIISVVIFYTKFSVSTVHVLDYNNFARLYENSSLKPIKVEIDWKKVNP